LIWGEPDVTDTMIEILLVEDNPGDVVLTKEALKQAEVKHRLNVVQDGVDAVDFLFRRGQYAEAPRPDLILLDLNLPRKNGRDVIAEIKAESSLRTTPLVVLTSSHHEEDALDGYNPARCLYMVKPPTFNAFTDAIRQIEQFWRAATSGPVGIREQNFRIE
jgi:chemotaxis family two-component system response regulator Rcp1